MKPETPPHYWRSLDQLAETPEFQLWMSREFPAGASEFSDPVSRRRFVKLMSASFLLAGLGVTGCRRPEEKIVPFTKQPENTIYGVPQYYATAMPTRRSAIPLVVKSYEGHPIKIEGNPDHPDSNGGTDAFAQASILGLYDPDRAMRFAQNGVTRTRQEALSFLSELPKQLGTGKGLAFLLEQSSSPSRARLQQLVSGQYPDARWFIYEPVDFDVHTCAATLAYGTTGRSRRRKEADLGYSRTQLRLLTSAATPRYQIDRAQVILSFDCDFLGSEENAAVNIRRFAKGRQGSMSRLYAVESLFTLTGANADHRLRAAPSELLSIIARFALELIDWPRLDPSGEFKNRVEPGLAAFAVHAKTHEAWIKACAKDLRARPGKSVALAGHRLPLPAHLLVLMINESLGALGPIVDFVTQTRAAQEGSLSELAAALDSQQVSTLVILNGNPVYNAPADLRWPQAQAKSKTVIRLGYYEDETAWNPTLHSLAQWDIPAAHYLESWGDARAEDGALVPIQPLIEPLFGGLTDLEFLARLAGLSQTNPRQLVRETFQEFGGSDEAAWDKFLRDGFLSSTAGAPEKVQFSWEGAFESILALQPSPSPALEKLDVVFHRDYSVDDGRYNNNGWLQELPDPITKITWDNAILLSPATARELGLSTEVVEIELEGRTLRGPLCIQPGMADYTIGLALGYGRQRTGRVGRNTGFNAYQIRSSSAMHYASGATLRKTADRYTLAITQSHWSMEGRDIVRETNLAATPRTPAVGSLYPNPLDTAKAGALHQWGMAIDLNLCVGCSACVTACQSENNIPIVGREMVAKSREMHWIRIDRYYSGAAESPRALTQPMFCQHCESAPCENVCPVNATVHDGEGLNVMVYNRCVGARYCSNNCPFKVRRFNFFDFNRRPLDQLYKSPLTTATDGEWELKRWLKDPDRGSRPNDEWQLSKLAKNPDVTVRMRGVMEKCTFCVQRLEEAKISQKIKAGASGHIRLSETKGTIPKTSCQQACPASAIVFGDISDPSSRVSSLKADSRNYTVLDALNLKPRVSYLAKARNPNPEMPQ